MSSSTTPQTCINCGTPVNDGARFCHGCGLSFTQEIAAVLPGSRTPPGGAPTVTPASTAVVRPAASTPDDDDVGLVRLRRALAGRYEVERELGRGGMATVYLATDVKHDRQVAIKVLLPDFSASIGAERFEREIKLAAKLQHPHILGLYDSGVAEDLAYYVMPFVKGESLRHRIDREGMLPVDDALGIALEVCDALGHAHAQGVIHRDIKPENILLQDGHALVADFGIAKAASEAGAEKLTQTGIAVGTPVYMAPEQAMGETVGTTADLYSLGCMLYEMLAGEPPFTGRNAAQILARHAMEGVPSIRIVRSAVPEEVEEAIFAAMGKQPADRPQTAAALAEMLGAPPSGSTATMRAMRHTSSRRMPSGSMATLTPPAGSPVLALPLWRRPVVLAAAALAVIAAFGAWRFTAGGGRGAATAAGPEARRLAVLYFKDLSKDGQLAPLADGLTEGLIRALSGASSLTIISQGGVGKYRTDTASVPAIARALRVGYLVRGDVEPDGEKVNVNLRLEDASGVKLRAASFIRPRGDLLAMRDTLSVIASDLIRQQLKQEITVRQQLASTSSAAAWLLLQRGEVERKNAEAGVLRGDSVTIERAFAGADSLYALAEKEDVKWADPVVARASMAYRRSRLAGRDAVLVRKWVDIGQQHAAHAMTVDGNSAEAHEVRGNLQYFAWLTIPPADAGAAKALLSAARADLEKATQLNPAQAGAWASLSHLYYNDGTTTDVSIAAQRALESDEFLENASTILGRLFLASYDLNQMPKAQQWCDETRRRFPVTVLATRCQLFLLTSRGQASDIATAWRLADSVVTLSPPARKAQQRFNADLLVAAVLARASGGKGALADSARRVAKRSSGDATIDPTRELALFAAMVSAQLGDRDDAVRLLKEYFAVNPQRVAAYADDPGWWFKPIADTPAYRQLVGRAK